MDEKTSVAETILKTVLYAVAAALKAILSAVAAALKAVLDAVVVALIEKTSIDESVPAGEGCAGKVVSAGDEHAPARDCAATETAVTEPAVEATASEAAAEAATAEPTVEAAAAEPTVEAAAAEPAVEATAAKPAAVERRGWRWKGD